MGVSRKCLKCGTWNGANDFCTNCGAAISPDAVENEREARREEVRKATPPSALDQFLHRWEHSPYLLVRITYKIVYSIAVVFFAIASFFAYLAASPNA